MYFNFNGSGKMITYEEMRLKQRNIIFCLTGIALIFLCVLFFVVSPVIAVTIDEIKNQPIIYSPIQNLINNTYFNSTINSSYVELSPSGISQTITKKVLIDGNFEVKNTTLSALIQGDFFVNTTINTVTIGKISPVTGDHGKFYLVDRGGKPYISGEMGAGFVSFGTSSGELFRYNSNNRIGIMTTFPTATLHLIGDVRLASLGAGTLTADAGGNITTVSDEKLKTGIKPFSVSAIEAIKKIIPIDYKYTKESGLDTNNFYTGFSAQNLETAIPSAVFTKQDIIYKTITHKGKMGENENADISETIEIPTGTTTKSISDRAIIATLILGIQEQQKQIDTLNERLNKLEGK